MDLDKGKASKTIYPHNKRGVHFLIEEKDYLKFAANCKLRNEKIKDRLEKLIIKDNESNL